MTPRLPFHCPFFDSILNRQCRCAGPFKWLRRPGLFIYYSRLFVCLGPRTGGLELHVCAMVLRNGVRDCACFVCGGCAEGEVVWNVSRLVIHYSLEAIARICVGYMR